AVCRKSKRNGRRARREAVETQQQQRWIGTPDLDGNIRGKRPHVRRQVESDWRGSISGESYLTDEGRSRKTDVDVPSRNSDVESQTRNRESRWRAGGYFRISQGPRQEIHRDAAIHRLVQPRR